MKSKSTRDALVEEDKTNVMQWHGKTEKKARGFRFWLEKLEHFDQLYNDDQRQCPEKLVCKIVRFRGFMDAVGEKHFIVYAWIL